MTDRWDKDSSPLTKEDRERILGRIHFSFYWLGKFIPEEEWLEGQEIPLRDVIFRFITLENPSQEDVEGALALSTLLQKKAKELEECIKDCPDLTKGKAHMLMDEVNGLLRAVDEIRYAKGADAQIKASALMAKVNDEERWMKFVKEIE